MSTNINVKYEELQALKSRFTLFLNKLMERAVELSDETRANAQLIHDEDEQSYFNFKNGIVGQFSGLERKADEVFETQIEPYHYRELMYDLGLSSMANMDNLMRLYDEISDHFNQWKDQISDLEKQAFAGVKKKKSAKQQLADVFAEFEELKDAFNCTQCGSTIPLETIYFMSTYVKCPACSSQNTFTPSSNMRQLPFIVREVAENKASKYNKMSDTGDEFSRFCNEDQYERAVLHFSNELIPVLEKENQDIYARNMFDRCTYFHGHNEEKTIFFDKVMRFYQDEILSSTKNMQKVLSESLQVEDFEKAYQSWRDDNLGVYKFLEKIKKVADGSESDLFAIVHHQVTQVLPSLIDWKQVWQQQGKAAVVERFAQG